MEKKNTNYFEKPYNQQMSEIMAKIRKAKKIERAYRKAYNTRKAKADEEGLNVSMQAIWSELEKKLGLSESQMRRMLRQAEIKL